MHGKGAILSCVMSWYLSDGEMSLYPVQGQHGYFFHETAGVDIINFAGNVSFDICRFGHGWTTLLNKTKYSSWVVLLGAGGVILYLWRKSVNNSLDTPSPRLSSRSFMKWLLDEELVEDETDDTSHVHGYYFGPSLSTNQGQYSSNDADEENDSDDLSLNSLSAQSSPCKFLKKPLFDLRFKNIAQHKSDNYAQITNPCPKCEKGTCRLKKHQLSKNPSNSSSCYSESPKTQLKISTADLLSNEEEQILQRTVASNKLTYLYYRSGNDLRMKGDGAESIYEIQNSVNHGTTQQRDSNERDCWSLSPGSWSRHKSRSCSPECGDPSCRDPRCYGLVQLGRDISIESITDQSCSLNASMADLVQNAKEARRLIREISFDSQASDLDSDLSFNNNIGGSTTREITQFSDELNQLINNCNYEEEESTAVPKESKLISSQSSENDLSADTENSLQWESPIRGWHTKKLYKPFVNNEVPINDSSDERSSFEGSILDLWEWENDCLNQENDKELVGDEAQQQETCSDKSNGFDFQPGIRKKEYGGSSESSRHTSRRSSTESNMKYIRRLPPSGRSSLERESILSRMSDFSTASEDITLTSAKTNPSFRLITMGPNPSRSRSSSVSSNSRLSLSPSLKDFPIIIASRNITENVSNLVNISTYSEESGFMDYEGSMDSSICSINSMNSSIFTSSINLSPVKEATEPHSLPEASPLSMKLVENGT